MERVVVIGASLAGLRACEALRSGGFDGQITLVGAEPEVPYDRPPLSKKFLAGEWEADRIRLRKAEEFANVHLDTMFGVSAVALDAASRTVSLDNGIKVSGDAVVIATGAQCRRLPQQPMFDGVVELRTLADSTSLRQRLGTGVKVVVIGAGFIGLEVAATARQKGCHVTVLEGAPAPMMRGLGADMGAAVAGVHARNGVSIRCGVGVEAIEGRHQHVTGVRVAGGEVVAADVVVVGVGVTPAIGWLVGSGLSLGDGVLCDSALHAGHGVFAAGDCARWMNLAFGDPSVGEEMRVEHWTNAAEQGAHAAANILAMSRDEPLAPFVSVPFFWSDQFDSRIQFVGRAHGDDEVHVFSGTTDGDFAALYGHEGRLRGVLGVNMPRKVMPFRGLVASGASWDEALAKAAELAG